MRFPKLLLGCLALLAAILLPGAVHAADGIPAGTYLIPSDVLPFTIDGVEAIHRTRFVATSDGGLITIDYVKGNTIEQVVYTVVRQDGPSPEPDPKPDPPPPAELWGIVIEESKDRGPEHAAVLASPEIRGLFPSDRFQVFDPIGDDGTPVVPPADLKPYVDRAMVDKSKWPMLFLVSPAGDVHYEGALPGTVAAMKTLVSQCKAKGGAH